MNDLIQHPIVPLTRQQILLLLTDLNANRVLTLNKGNSKNSYLAAWDVRATLTRVFGFGGWSGRVVDDSVLQATYQGEPKHGATKGAIKVTARARYQLYIHQLGAIYEEAAVSTQVGSTFGDVTDFALKTAASDAMKRCAMNLGTQFGLSLYNNGSISDVVLDTVAPGQNRLDRDWAGYELTKASAPKIAALTGQVPEEVPNLQSVPSTEPGMPLPEDEARGHADDAEPTAQPMPEQDARAAVAGAFGGQQ